MNRKFRKNSINKTPRVKFYSGYKNRETPRSIILEGKEFSIEKIKERKRVFDPDKKQIFNQFTCQIKDRTYVIKVPEVSPKDKVEVYQKSKKQ